MVASGDGVGEGGGNVGVIVGAGGGNVGVPVAGMLVVATGGGTLVAGGSGSVAVATDSALVVVAGNGTRSASLKRSDCAAEAPIGLAACIISGR
jgi:hypothetical protein